MADDAPAGDLCQARSKPLNPRKPDSYLVCTNDAGHHGDPRHTACDGQGHVIARWRSETSPIEIWTPAGKLWA